MGRTQSHDAIILKTYDIGDADKFCILLTPSAGRLNATAKGVRKLGSKSSGALQSFQRVQIDLSEHSSGLYVRGAECVQSFASVRADTEKYVHASRGVELLLHFLHDTEPSESIFDLSRAYLEQCDHRISSMLFHAFQISLMKELGVLPLYEENDFSPSLLLFLASGSRFEQKLGIDLSAGEQRKAQELCQAMLREQLSFPLKSEKDFCVV